MASGKALVFVTGRELLEHGAWRSSHIGFWASDDHVLVIASSLNGTE